VIPFTKDQLMAAPADTLQELTRGDGVAAFRQRAHDYYQGPMGTPPAQQ